MVGQQQYTHKSFSNIIECDRGMELTCYKKKNNKLPIFWLQNTEPIGRIVKWNIIQYSARFDSLCDEHTYTNATLVLSITSVALVFSMCLTCPGTQSGMHKIEISCRQYMVDTFGCCYTAASFAHMSCGDEQSKTIICGTLSVENTTGIRFGFSYGALKPKLSWHIQ